MLDLALPIAVVLSLIFLNGLFAMAEIALISSKRFRLQQQAEEGSTSARKALSLLKEPSRFLSTVQIGITLVAIVSGAFGEASIAGQLADYFQDAGLNSGVSEAASTAIVVLSIAYLAIVFGELVPKRIGLAYPEKIAAFSALPMGLISRAASPIVSLLSGSSNIVLRILHTGSHDDGTITEEEIRLLIGQSAETGEVEEREAELLDRVFHFGDRRVHEVMTPRTEAVWVEKDGTLRDFYTVYAAAPHSRFPVFDDTPDKVVGILGIKDVLVELAAGRADLDTKVESFTRPAYFVPETKLIGDLFREMQASGTQMAIAVDEFGGTAGIVTLEQLLEEMFGPLGDELRASEEEITTIDERTIQVDGSLSIVEARDELEIDFPEGEYDTIAGFVLSRLGRVPREGDFVAVDDHRLTVAEMRGPKIERLLLTKA